MLQISIETSIPYVQNKKRFGVVYEKQTSRGLFLAPPDESRRAFVRVFPWGPQLPSAVSQPPRETWSAVVGGVLLAGVTVTASSKRVLARATILAVVTTLPLAVGASAIDLSNLLGHTRNPPVVTPLSVLQRHPSYAAKTLLSRTAISFSC